MSFISSDIADTAVDQVVMRKAEIRTNMVRRLKQQKEDDRRRKSEAIGRKLFHLAAFRQAKTVGCYVSLSYEVETRQLITQMLEVGKRVAVPVMRGQTLAFSELRDPDAELAPGAFGVWEPTAAHHRPVPVDALDLVLVPGIAFDRDGHRLGHGHGTFDRFLAGLPATVVTVGLCFDFQLVESPLPRASHDQTVHTVLSA